MTLSTIRTLSSASRAALGAAFLLLAAAPAAAQPITFDEPGICTGDGGGINLIPNGYAGLDWSNVWTLPRTFGSGWDPGSVSEPCAAYNGFGAQAEFGRATPFALGSAYFTAGFSDGLEIVVEGFLGGAPVHSTRLTLSLHTPLLATFNWGAVDLVRMNGDGRTGNPHFVMDDLTIGAVSAVPEPGTWALLGTGLAALAGVARRRRRA